MWWGYHHGELRWSNGIYWDITNSICLGRGPENGLFLPQIEGHLIGNMMSFPWKGPQFWDQPTISVIGEELGIALVFKIERIPFHGWTHLIPWWKVYVSMKIPMDVIWIGWFSRSEPHIFINLPLKSQIPAWCRYVPFGNPNHTPKDDIRVPYLLGKLGF